MGIEGTLPTLSMLFRLMCLCLVFLFCFSKADITVRAVDRDLPSEQDRTLLCQWTGQQRCATACVGQSCSSSCTATCGYLLPRTVTFSCQTVAASTCSTG